ncbi:helicase-related protein [Aquisalimonas asiatica]|uniref:DEAD/DEAH box helicase n=1 Tax=Aquisalimonas asiatica TaxID=406100 RepID=A0A1H8V1H2_9GAMM|nr:helicase-related protein [Aquisalimonas asiatica]SEP09241.1 DEAD/DEAH box helicase [Aquisalimonas asiatica]
MTTQPSDATREQATLPIDPLRAAVGEALDTGHVVVTAATGTGKSTRLPVWAAVRGAVLVVEPRRIAAIGLAERVAQDTQTPPGAYVGHAVRGDARYNADTTIVFVTPGMALNWLMRDGLSRFATIVLDEFHERRWDTDLLLALLKARGEHRLLVTSATLEGERLATWLGATHLEADGNSHPVTVEHRADNPRAMPHDDRLAERVAAAVEDCLANDDGDVLVFLPGRREIDAAARALHGLAADVIPLHGGASAREQRRALAPGNGARVILATNVAETSLTVPGVTGVVDSGLERRTAQRNGRTVLTLGPVAKANAEQRRGRAGRTAPGRCIRLWGAQAPLAAVTPPETQREDLTDLALAAASAGAPACSLDFPDPLPPAPLARAESRLRALGALADDGTATPLGQQLFSLPVETQLATLILSMPDADTRGVMVDLAAALTSGRGMVSPPPDPDQRQRLTRALGRRCDATLLVAAVRDVDLPEATIAGAACSEARALATQLRDDLGLPAIPSTLTADVMEQALTHALPRAPDMVFVRRPRRREAMGNGGSELQPGRRSLFGERDEAALVLDDHSVPGRGTRQTLTVGTCMAPVPLAALVSAGLAEVSVAAPSLDHGRLTCQQQWHYAGRLLQEQAVEPQGEAARRAMATLILAGRLLRPAGERLRDDMEAWWLYQHVELDTTAEPGDPETWLLDRLQSLGVEHGDDLALIEADDLRFDGVPDWERDRFDARFPRQWSLPSLELRLHYEPRRRRVTAEQTGGTRRKPPQRWELPAWPGWEVRFRKASRDVRID